MKPFKRHGDVAIIGAGVIGCSIALELSRLGYKVNVFDKNSGPGAGTTSYSSGILRCFYSLPEMIAFSWECYQHWRSWEEHLQMKPVTQPQLRRIGALLLNNHHTEEFIKKQITVCDQLKMPYEVLDLEQTKEKVGKVGWDISRVWEPRRITDPQFDQPLPGRATTGSFWLPETGYISDPRLATQNLAEAATALGAEFNYGSEVCGIAQEGGKVNGLMLREGPVFLKFETPIVINAAGPYSHLITEMAFPKDTAGSSTPANDMKITTRPLRAEVAFLQPPPGVDMDKDGFMTADFDLGTYMRPEVGNKVLVGSLDPACDPFEWVEGDLASMDTNFGDQWEHCVYRAALRMPQLPIPTARSAQGIVSTYDATEDWQPILDKSNLEGFFMAIGTSGNCFKCSPVIGKTMAAIVDKTVQEAKKGGGFNHDVTPIQLPLIKTGHTLNTGAFSRLRTPHKTTAGVIG